MPEPSSPSLVPSSRISQPPSFSLNSLTSNTALSNLTTSIISYQENLTDFTQYVQAVIARNESTKCQCRNILSSSFTQLRQTFTEFSNEWKVELPMVLQQFCEIVRKICDLYNQEICQLQQKNDEWEIKYNNILKPSQQVPQTRMPLTDIVEKVNQSQNQMVKLNTIEDLPSEHPMMFEQITELFGDSKDHNSWKEDNFQFYLRTNSEDQCHFNGKEQAEIKSNLISRKNSSTGDSFWTNLKATASYKSSFRGKSNSKGSKNNNKKENSYKSTKERMSFDEFRPSGKHKLTQLRKNLFHNQRMSLDRK